MGWIFWDKQTGESDYSDGELAYTSFNRALRKFTWLWNGFRQAEVEERIHITQKPVALFEYLIKTYTNENDIVLDNCAGSGTTGVACKNTNRNYILIEKEPEYIKIIEERLK